MKIITLSQREIKDARIYNTIKEKHVVISITSAQDEEITLPNNVTRVSQLFLKFDDVQDIDERFIYFDRGMAKEICDFVETHINSISLIIVQCQAGISRSVAIGAALSKIINYSDDAVYTKGIPNMFVYTTILDFFFGSRYWKNEYPKIAYKRHQAMNYYLNPATIKLGSVMDKKRSNDYE